MIWIAQFVGREIRMLDYSEAQGQPLATHVQWLRKNKYEDALMVLPHDGAAHDKVPCSELALRRKSCLTKAALRLPSVSRRRAGSSLAFGSIK